MWKNLTIGAVIVTVLALVIIGPRSLWTTLRGTREVIHNAIEEGKSDVQQAAEIRIGLQELDDKIFRFDSTMAEVEGRAQAARQRVQETEQELATQKDLLARAKKLLDEPKDTYRVAGRSYTRAEVNADALARLSHCKQLLKQLDFDRQVARQLGDAVKEARTNLAKAQQVRQEKASQLVTLEARLENARLLEQVNELTRELKTSPLGPQTELAQKFEAFERRVATVERRIRTSGGGPAESPIIDWKNGSGTVAEARDAIARFLDGGPGKSAK
jgi:hypothetical protein